MSLHHTAPHCNIRFGRVDECESHGSYEWVNTILSYLRGFEFNTPAHSLQHCTTLQHTMNTFTVSNSAPLWAHCNTLQHTTKHYNTLYKRARFRIQHGCKFTATNCNILQYTIKPCIVSNSAPLRVWRNSEKVENWWNYVCRVVDKSRISWGQKSPQHCWKKL